MRGCATFMAILFIVLVALGALAYAGYQGGMKVFEAALRPMDPQGGEVEVTVPGGATAAEIGRILYEGGLTRHPELVRLYARFKGLDQSLKPGDYLLSRRMSVEEILQKLQLGDVITLRFTLPEGLTVVETAALLAAKGIVNERRFLDLAARSTLTQPYLAAGVRVSQPLEGYLFPDTYQVRRGATEELIIDMLFSRFRVMWKKEYDDRARELGLSMHEVVTLASIIEKEAAVAGERKTISGVYHNRLRIGMKLDADPTVRYGLGKKAGEPLTAADLERPGPYNTYKVAGLPPGPIASPGEEAIRAALFPQEHRYFYFVAKEDGSQEHYFSATFEEHVAAIQRAGQQRRP